MARAKRIWIILLFWWGIHIENESWLSDGSLLFVGTYTDPMRHVPNANGEGIYVYNVSSTAGEAASLVHVATIRDILNPSYIEITHNKKYLYTVSESYSLEDSFIHAFQISPPGQSPFRYDRIGTLPTGGAQPVHLTIDARDRFLFVSNFAGGSVAAFKIDPDTGRLKGSNFHQFTEFSNIVELQQGPHLHSSLVDDQMRFVFFADLGNDCIWRMNYSPEKGFDTESLKMFPAPPASGPRHMAFSPLDQRYLYVSCQLSNRLLVYKVDEEGSLEQIQYTSTSERRSGREATADLRMSSDGKYVYVSVRFIDIISVFEVSANGTARVVQEINSGGRIPRFLLLSQEQNLLLVGNQESHSLAIFQRQLEKGALSYSQQWHVESPACLKLVENE